MNIFPARFTRRRSVAPRAPAAPPASPPARPSTPAQQQPSARGQTGQGGSAQGRPSAYRHTLHTLHTLHTPHYTLTGCLAPFRSCFSTTAAAMPVGPRTANRTGAHPTATPSAAPSARPPVVGDAAQQVALERIQPNIWKDIFVNRTDELNLFSDKLSTIPKDSSSMINFYGVAGQGKTFLLQHLAESAVASLPNIKDVSIGYRAYTPFSNQDSIKILINLRNTLGNDMSGQHHHFQSSAMDFPAFDFVVAAYWHRAHPNEPLPTEYQQAGIINAYDILTSLASETLAATVEATPIIGTTVSTGMDLAAKVGKYIKQKYTEHTDAIIKSVSQTFKEDGTFHPPYQIAQLASPALAHDVSRFTNNGQRQIVLLLDEFENLLNDPSVGQNYRTVAEFIDLSEGLLVAIGSREKLPSVKTHFDRLLTDNQHHLKGLDKQFAEEYLTKQDIPIAFHETMIAGASTQDPDTGDVTAFPLFLNLQTQIFHIVQDQKQRADPPGQVELSDIVVTGSNFEQRLDQLTNRLFRGYDLNTRASVQQLICARSVSPELQQDLIRNRGVSALAVDLMLKQNYAHIDDQGTLSFHEPFSGTVRKQLLEDSSSRNFFQMTQQHLKRYHEAQLQPIDHTTSPVKKQKNLEAFHAALYHVFQLELHKGDTHSAIQSTQNWALQQIDKIYHQMRDSHVPLVRPVYEHVAQHVLSTRDGQQAYFSRIQPSSLFITDLACQKLYDKAADALQELESRGIDANMRSTAIAIKYLDVAQIAEQYGDLKPAKDFYQGALKLHQEATNSTEDHGTAVILRDLAAVADKLGEKEEALAHLTQSLVLKQQLPDVNQEELVSTRIHLASLQLKYGNDLQNAPDSKIAPLTLIQEGVDELEQLHRLRPSQTLSRQALDKTRDILHLKQSVADIKPQGQENDQLLELVKRLAILHHGPEHPETLAIEAIILDKHYKTGGANEQKISVV